MAELAEAFLAKALWMSSPSRPDCARAALHLRWASRPGKHMKGQTKSV